MRIIFLTLLLLSAPLLHASVCKDSTKIKARGTTLDISNNNNFSSFSVLDSIAGKYRVVLTGEDHRYLKSNRLLELKLTKYFYSHGHRVCLDESGFVTAWVMNEYINSGDTILRQLMDLYFTNAYARHIRDLADFNLALPDSGRIKIAGLDIERNIPMSIKVMAMKLPERKVHDSLLLWVETMKTYAGYFDQLALRASRIPNLSYYLDYENDTMIENEIRKAFGEDWDLATYNRGEYYNTYNSVNAIVNEFRGKEAYFRDYLAEQYEFYHKIMAELSKWLKWTSYGNSYTPFQGVYREQQMAENFRQLYLSDTTARFYGQFGRCHTLLTQKNQDCMKGYFSSISTRIASLEELPPENRIFTIGIFYNSHYDFVEKKDNDPIEDLVDIAKDDSLTLFDIRPFRKDNARLATRFDMVIINKRKATVQNNGIRKTGQSHFYYEDWKNIFSLGVGARTIGFGAFREVRGFDFGDYLPAIDLAFTQMTDEDICFSFEAGFMARKSISQGDTVHTSLRGFHSSFKLGWDLISSLRHDLALMGGVGYQHYKIRYLNKNQSGGLFDEPQSYSYLNPAFIADVSMQYYWYVNRLSLGFKGGYTFDLSSPKWWSNGERLESAGGSKIGGFYSAVSIGLWFEAY